MKLISLNLWGGMLFQPLMQFLKEWSLKTDIFCFQEVFNKRNRNAPTTKGPVRLDLLDRLREILPNFYIEYFPTSKGHDLLGQVELSTEIGLATCIKKDFAILSKVKHVIYGNLEDRVREDFTNIPRGLLEVKAVFQNQPVYIYNYHGIPKPGDKLDTKERIQQSKKIVGIMKKTSGPKIFCGDLNLMPETESMQLIENAGFINLIKKFRIPATRNKISWQQYHTVQNFADYIFVSKEIGVKAFEVTYNEISDHLPMILEFNIA